MPVHAGQSLKRGRPPLATPDPVKLATPLHAIGLRVKRLRRERGWSQVGLARAVKTCPKVLRHIERCESIPTLPVLLRVRDAFGCDWTALLGEPVKAKVA